MLQLDDCEVGMCVMVVEQIKDDPPEWDWEARTFAMQQQRESMVRPLVPMRVLSIDWPYLAVCFAINEQFRHEPREVVETLDATRCVLRKVPWEFARNWSGITMSQLAQAWEARSKHFESETEKLKHNVEILARENSELKTLLASCNVKKPRRSKPQKERGATT